MSLTVSALRLVRRFTDAIGVDIGTDLAPLIATARPPMAVTAGLNVRRDEFEKIPTVTIQRNRPNSRDVIVAIPGGAYVVGPTLMHWAIYSLMARRTGAAVVVPVYPLATEGGTAGSVVRRIANLISNQVASNPLGKVGVYGWQQTTRCPRRWSLFRHFLTSR